MLLATTNDIPGKKLEVLGVVQGSVVKTKHLGRDFMAGFRTLVGGEIKSYTQLLVEARETAAARMQEQARFMGADAVIAVRYSTANIIATAAEVLVYGTAVKFV